MRQQPDPLTAIRWMLDGLLLVIVLAVIAAFVVARGLPAVGHETVIVTGRSMEPAVPLGSTVLLESVAVEAIAAGDVVTARVPETGSQITHRVVEPVERADGRWLRIKGDANDEPDPALVPAGWVVGRVSMVIPWLGYLLLLLSSVSGTLAILSLSLTLYLAARLVEDLEWDRRHARRRSSPTTPLAATPLAATPLPAASPAAGPAIHAAAPDSARRHAQTLRRGRRGSRVRRWQA